MPDLMNRDKHFSDVTRLYRNAKGEARIAYRTVLDLICDSEIISGDKIGELCEQIKELAVDLDTFTELKRLVKEHRRVEWRCVGGNPAESAYDKFCAKYNGYKSTCHKCVRDNLGNFRDLYTYEILREMIP